MKELHPNDGLRVFDIKWRVKTAGPSPNNNERIEVFLLGCEKAINGNPCEGCFNSITWDKSIAEFSRDPIELADTINKTANDVNTPKYITIGGGEPTDQIDKLIPFIKRLKEHNFHIIMYTWRDLKESLKINSPLQNKLKEAIKYLDIIIDGEFKKDEVLLDFKSKNNACHFVGSGNQVIWNLDTPIQYGYSLKAIDDIKLEENELSIKLKSNIISELKLIDKED